jgi:hypothetical protein
MPPPGLEELETILGSVPSRLRALDPEEVGRKPGPGRWSGKEELGHLIDSALNNHRRLVLAQLEDAPALCGYDGDGWVAVQRYHARGWGDLVDAWLAHNRHLLHAARAASPDSWERLCTVGGAAPVTLAYVLEDYVRHLRHHLQRLGVSTTP